MLSEATRGLRRDSGPVEETFMVADRPAIKMQGIVFRILEGIKPWQRAEIRLTYALSDAETDEIALAVGVDREAVYLITRANPLDDPRRHREMPRGHDGIVLSKEFAVQDCGVSGSSANTNKAWERVIEEIKENSSGNPMVDVSALTPDMGARINSGRAGKQALAEVGPVMRLAVRLAYTQTDMESESIAIELGLAPSITSRLTRSDEGKSSPMNRGTLGIRQTKDLFFSERQVRRSTADTDEAAWVEALIDVRNMKLPMLKDLDWRFVDLMAKAREAGNPLLVDLGAVK